MDSDMEHMEKFSAEDLVFLSYFLRGGGCCLECIIKTYIKKSNASVEQIKAWYGDPYFKDPDIRFIIAQAYSERPDASIQLLASWYAKEENSIIRSELGRILREKLVEDHQKYQST